MSDKTYVTFAGTVQQYGDQPVTTSFDANGTTGHNVSIRSAGGQGSTIRLTLWEPDYTDFIPHITKGMFLSGEGAYTGNTKDGRTYHNVSVISLNAVATVKRAERVVNTAVNTAVNANAAPGVPSF